jgi:hypothetical protein
MKNGVAVGVVLLAALSAGCRRHHRADAPSPPSASISQAEIQRQSDEALAQLAVVRGLAPKRQIPVRVVDALDYRAELTKRMATLLTAGSTPLSSLWTALNFADPSARPEAIAQRVLDDSQVDAFYDADTTTVVVRRPKTRGYDARTDVAVIMALEYALQHQHFGPSPKGIGVDVDRALASLALREGDAAAASMAYFAKRSGKPIAQTVERTAVLLDSLPVDALITSIGYATALGSAPLLVRDELARARPAGLRLVAAMLRAKGFALVNQALTHPPTTMLAMYDPALYVRGWRPMAMPPLPKTVRQDVHGSLGVIGIVAFLERCEPTQRAKSYVADWRGDAFSIDAHGATGPTILWRTAWKDEAAARRFADEISGTAQCRAPGTSAAVHFEVARNGVVAVLTNGDEAIASTVAAQGAQLSTPTAPPLGDATLELTLSAGPHYAGRPAIEVRKSGELKGSHYRNARLGFEADIPSGFEVATDEILAIDHPPPSLASGRVVFEQTAAPLENQQDFFAAFRDRIGRAFFRGAPLSEIAAGQEQSAFGTSPYRVYEMRSGRVARVRIAALPLCGGRAALIVSEVFMDDAGATQLQKWLRSFKPRSNAAVCRVLQATAP